MNAPCLDIKDILEGESTLGLTFATNLFVSREPEKPNVCVTIFDTPGYSPDLSLDASERYERPGIQIRARGFKYDEVYATMQNIKDLLHGRAHVSLNGSYYSLIRASSDIMLLDWDDNERCRLILKFNMQRR